MKKTVLFLLSILCVGQVMAQVFTLGPRLGINMASLTHFSEQDNFDPEYVSNGQLLNLYGGLITNLEITRNFSLQAEFLYSKKGHRLIYDADTVDFNMDGYRKFVNGYFEVPVLLKYAFGPDEVRGFINVGPYWGKWLHGKYKTKVDYVEAGEEWTYDEDESIDFDADFEGLGYEANRADFGLVLGGGFMYETGPGNLLIDFRYTRSFRDIYDWNDSTDKPEGYKEMKNRVFAITFGYLFYL